MFQINESIWVGIDLASSGSDTIGFMCSDCRDVMVTADEALQHECKEERDKKTYVRLLDREIERLNKELSASEYCFHEFCKLSDERESSYLQKIQALDAELSQYQRTETRKVKDDRDK